jgi:raffinose/stachyose/melibiose transport system substrate-binding protein
MRTRTLTAVGLTLLLAFAAGCGDDGGSKGGETLTVWSWRTEDVAAYKKIFAAFEKDTGIKAEFKPYKNTEYNTILETALKGGKGPDVAQLRAYGPLQPLIDGRNLVPLDDVGALKDFSQQALDGARSVKDGKVYGVPFAIQTLQVFYNKKIFQEQGLQEPTTPEEFKAVADKLKQAGITPLAVGGKDIWTLPILHSVVGADVYGADEFVTAALDGSKKLTAPEFVDSIAAVDELEPYFPKDPAGVAYTDTQILFTQEKAAMFIGGSYETGYFQTTNPNLEFGTFPFPRHDGSGQPGLVSWFTDGSFGVNAASKKKDAAKKLVEWMATKKFGQMFTDELKQISPVPGVKPTDPNLTEIVADYDKAKTPYMMLVYFRYGDPIGTDLIGEGIQEMMLGETKPPGVAEHVQKGISGWFKPGTLKEVASN